MSTWVRTKLEYLRWQELLLREAKVYKGINLLSALKIFVPFLGKPFYWVPFCLCFRALACNLIE